MPKFTAMRLYYPFLFLFLVFQSPLTAQSYERLDIPFIVGGVTLDLALVGGLNSPQFSTVDFNNDGQQDLHVFDRVGDVQLAFVHDGVPGSTNYSYQPELLENFPPITNWMLLRDYNGDGIQDIFAYSDVIGVSGIIVYKGVYNNGLIDFERIHFPEFVEDLLFFPNPIPSAPPLQIAVTNIDYPAVDDMDCDGDLDILTFNPSGGYVELFQNRSVEMGYGLDTLLFRLDETCWGGFYESGLLAEVDLSPVMGECFENFTGEDPVEFRHAGSTLLTFDADNDNDKELILGDLTFPNLVYLKNGGDCDKAWINEQDANFPSYDVSTDIPIFPGSFYLDVNYDGHNDLLAAANNRLNSEDNEVWFYQNVADNEQPEFALQQEDFLVGEMIDMGSGANPAFVDYNADGLMDLVVGNFTFFQSFAEKDVRLFLFENTGTLTNPRFELVDTDYLNMNQFSQNATNYSPAFGDLDSDGDMDVLIGDDMGQLFYAENTAGAGNPLSFGPISYAYMGINVGQTAVPHIVDLDRDGLVDLVIGEKQGNVNFFKNVGTATEPQFNANQDEAPNKAILGNLDARTAGLVDGYSAPWVIDIDGSYRFIMATNHGRIEMYKDIDGHVYDPFTEVTVNLGQVDDGARTRTAFHDINNDGYLDMLVGNFRGGLTWYSTDLPSGVMVATEAPNLPSSAVKISPNPAHDRLRVETNLELNGRVTLQVLTVTGQLVYQHRLQAQDEVIDLNGLNSGVYFLKIDAEEGIVTKKLVIAR